MKNKVLVLIAIIEAIILVLVSGYRIYEYFYMNKSDDVNIPNNEVIENKKDEIIVDLPSFEDDFYKAEYVYSWFYGFNSIKITSKEKIDNYYRVKVDGLNSKSDLEKLLNTLFSENIVNELLNKKIEDDYLFKDIDGVLYVYGGYVSEYSYNEVNRTISKEEVSSDKTIYNISITSENGINDCNTTYTYNYEKNSDGKLVFTNFEVPVSVCYNLIDKENTDNNEEISNENSNNEKVNEDIKDDIELNKEKAIYFYQNGDELLFLNPNELDKKDEYNQKYTYLSNYICDDESCEVLTSSGHAGSGRIKYTIKSEGIFIRTAMEKFCFFDYKNNKTLYTYDIYPYIACNSVDGGGTLLYHQEDKVAIIRKNGEISPFYDDIMGGNYGGVYDLNFSNKYGISQYANNGKEGIISLITGEEITKTIYDEVLIYHDNIIVKQNNLYYVVDEKGNIKSSGYKNILDATDKVIIIEDNGLIDIIDYNGISKINEKLDARGITKVFRNPCSGPTAVGKTLMEIDVNNNDVKISIQDISENFIYTYNQETELLNIETKSY